MTDINTGYDVIVLGDHDTGQRMEMLSEKAAEQGAVIAQTFCFDPGEAAAQDDLSEVEAVVEALSRALVTRTDIWVPFPLQDLCREQHLRRLCLALQRHGLNLLMGPELTACPTDGGFNEIDAALRAEVRAVDDLDGAALAAAGARTLGDEIEAALAVAADHSGPPWATPDAPPLDEEDPRPPHYFGTGEVAAHFGKPNSWVDHGLRTRAFTYPDGSPIRPLKSGKYGRRRFTVPMVRSMAWSCYRRGTLNSAELLRLLAYLSRYEE